MILFFMLPSICSTIFSAFSCVSFDDDGTLVKFQRVDLSLMCEDGGERTATHEFTIIYASVMIALYPIGL